MIVLVMLVTTPVDAQDACADESKRVDEEWRVRLTLREAHLTEHTLMATAPDPAPRIVQSAA